MNEGIHLDLDTWNLLLYCIPYFGIAIAHPLLINKMLCCAAQECFNLGTAEGFLLFFCFFFELLNLYSLRRGVLNLIFTHRRGQ